MIAGQPHHNWPTLTEVLDRCKQRGCIVRQLTGEIVDDDGAWKIYALENKGNGAFITLDGIEDNERTPPSWRASLERRLGITLGFEF